MSEQARLSLGGSPVERPVVDVYGKSFTLRAHTRSVEKRLAQADKALSAVTKDEDSEGDAYVELLAEVIDAMLAPEGGHRTPAKKLVIDKWNADELGVDELKRFTDGLQEQGAERPT